MRTFENVRRALASISEGQSINFEWAPGCNAKSGVRFRARSWMQDAFPLPRRDQTGSLGSWNKGFEGVIFGKEAPFIKLCFTLEFVFCGKFDQLKLAKSLLHPSPLFQLCYNFVSIFIIATEQSLYLNLDPFKSQDGASVQVHNFDAIMHIIFQAMI